MVNECQLCPFICNAAKGWYPLWGTVVVVVGGWVGARVLTGCCLSPCPAAAAAAAGLANRWTFAGRAHRCCRRGSTRLRAQGNASCAGGGGAWLWNVMHQEPTECRSNATGLGVVLQVRVREASPGGCRWCKCPPRPPGPNLAIACHWECNSRARKPWELHARKGKHMVPQSRLFGSQPASQRQRQPRVAPRAALYILPCRAPRTHQRLKLRG